ncbi:MAG: putative Signal transduction histidine kinase [Promethearchaeota archaeon]|nr:MAG: putative Signal transduction histidine kinase [Candidatus Lokiarchaeota archaeon]
MFFIQDMDLNIVYVNSYAEQIFGYHTDKIKMGSMAQWMEPNSLKKAYKNFDKYIRLAKESEKFDIPVMIYKYIRKDGSSFWGELKISFLRDSDGTLIGFQGILRDITKRIEAEEKFNRIHDDLKKLENIIKNSPYVVFLLKNQNGWPVEFVSNNIDNFGYSPKDFYSNQINFADLIHPDDLDRVRDEVQSYSRKDVKKFNQEYRIFTGRGKCRWIDDRKWIRRNDAGEITHFQAGIIDITQRKSIERKLKISEKKYKEAYLRSSFYKDLFAHDINNLLHTINSSAELILYNFAKTLGLEEFENLTNIIIEQVRRGKKLVKNVQLISELDAEDVLKEPVDLNEIIKKAERFVKIAYDQKEINIQIENTIEKPIVLANQILQDVFENLFINSIKYNENETIEISLKILPKNIKMLRYIEVEIIDNGVGIPDYHKQVLFNRENRYNEGSNGMGLGLSLIKKFIESFNGEIYVKNKVPKDYTQGTKFLIRLPRVD